MAKFIPRNKLSKKARKALDAGQRTTWECSPTTRKIESRKRYNRKKKSHVRYDDGMGFSWFRTVNARFPASRSPQCAG